MFVFLNGKFVPEHDAKISVFDRGFLYGDGLFETVRVTGGRSIRWREHLQRLQHGADCLRIRLPFTPDQLGEAAAALLGKNGAQECLLRLTLSRGAGRRGYSTAGAGEPTFVMSTHPAPALDPAVPAQWRLITSTVRVRRADPLLRIKTANKLPQILAKMEAEQRGVDDALLVNETGEVTESGSANLFWVERDTVCTTPISAGVLPGITRAAVLELCRQNGIPTEEKTISAGQLAAAAGVFLTLASWGVVEVVELDGVQLNRRPMLASIHRAWVSGAESNP